MRPQRTSERLTIRCLASPGTPPRPRSAKQKKHRDLAEMNKGKRRLSFSPCTIPTGSHVSLHTAALVESRVADFWRPRFAVSFTTDSATRNGATHWVSNDSSQSLQCTPPHNFTPHAIIVSTISKPFTPSSHKLHGSFVPPSSSRTVSSSPVDDRRWGVGGEEGGEEGVGDVG